MRKVKKYFVSLGTCELCRFFENDDGDDNDENNDSDNDDDENDDGDELKPLGRCAGLVSMVMSRTSLAMLEENEAMAFNQIIVISSQHVFGTYIGAPYQVKR